MTRIPRIIAAPLLALLLASCATPGTPVEAGKPCETESFSVVDDFSGARRGACTVMSDNRVKLEIVPEDGQVKNPSPWYAFKLIPTESGRARIVLDYGTWKHRYWPKISTDGKKWLPLDANSVHGEPKAHSVELLVSLGDKPVWVAAQEIVPPSAYKAWNARTAKKTGATLSVLGESAADQPIYLLDSGGDAQQVVLLTGRQHPPEVSGAYAFTAFTGVVLGDTPLAQQFRERFRVLAIPLLNPDGVTAGHWRHNLGSTDLNRDWGPFAQPETRLVEGLLDALDNNGTEVMAFIDFHSTDRNVFYTQTDNEGNRLPGFEKTWLDRARPRIEDYPFERSARLTSEQPNGKNYMFKRYGMPSLTYEVGDETPRQTAAAAAVVFAEEFMQLMLETAP
jgi:hypothetical protein